MTPDSMPSATPTTAEDPRDWMLQLEQEGNMAQELLGEHDAITGRRFEEHANLGWRFWKHTYLIVFPTEKGFRAGPVHYVAIRL